MGDGNIAFADLPHHLGYLRIAAFDAYAGETSTFQADTAVLSRALKSVFTPARTRSLRGLPDGIQFGLPNEEFVTLAGQTFDNRGIPPNIYIPVFTGHQLAHHLDPALEEAIRVLSR